MNIIQILPLLPWVKILAATVAYFAIGALWYSDLLFGKQWLADNKFPKDFMKRKMNMALTFGGSFILMLVVIVNLTMLLGPGSVRPFSTIIALVVGLGFMAPVVGIGCLYTGKPFRLFVIDAGYHVLAMVIVGTILGWR